MTPEQKWMYFEIALRSLSRRTPFAWLACLGALSVAASVAMMLLGGRAVDPESRVEDRWVPPENSADVARNMRIVERRGRSVAWNNAVIWLMLAGAAMIAIGALPFVVLSE
ncbi:MAG: hypothetical protein M0D55_10430 [Elusimicrobiota bacterium]|nr:MAG: hypothetical protein M0D55_10430 [Elusimicrobiota bacterium]